MSNTIAIEGYLSKVYTEEYLAIESARLADEICGALEADEGGLTPTIGQRIAGGFKTIGESIVRLVKAIIKKFQDLIQRVGYMVGHARTKNLNKVTTSAANKRAWDAYWSTAGKFLTDAQGVLEAATQRAASAAETVKMAGRDRNYGDQGLTDLTNKVTALNELKDKALNVKLPNMKDAGDNAKAEITGLQQVVSTVAACEKTARAGIATMRKLENTFTRMAGDKKTDEGNAESMKACAEALRDTSALASSVTAVVYRTQGMINKLAGTANNVDSRTQKQVLAEGGKEFQKSQAERAKAEKEEAKRMSPKARAMAAAKNKK